MTVDHIWKPQSVLYGVQLSPLELVILDI